MRVVLVVLGNNREASFITFNNPSVPDFMILIVYGSDYIARFCNSNDKG